MLRVFLVLLLLLTACSGTRPSAPPSALAGLPAVGDLPAAPRTASATLLRNGDEALLTGGLTSPGPQPGQLVLTGLPDELAWAIYQFDVPDDTLLASYTIDAEPGGEYYSAPANFDELHWEHRGLGTGTTTQTLGVAGTYSSGMHAYVAVICHGGQSVTLNAVTLAVPGPSDVLSIHRHGDPFWGMLDDCALDNQGKLWACGADQSIPNAMCLLRYAPDGITLEVAKKITYDNFSFAYALAVGPDDSVYVTGKTQAGQGLPNMPLLKFNNDGTLAWSRAAAVPSYTADLMGIAVDPLNDSVYIAGTVGGGEYQVAAGFSGTGELLWAQRWPNGGAFIDYPGDVLATGSAVYVATTYTDPITRIGDGLLLSFSPAGVANWDRTWVAAPLLPGDYGYERRPCLATDGNGNIVWAGGHRSSYMTPDVKFNASLITFDALGQLVWQSGYQCAGSTNQIGTTGITRDAGGNFTVSISDPGLGPAESLLLRFDGTGGVIGGWHLLDGTGSPAPYCLQGITAVDENLFWGVGTSTNFSGTQLVDAGGQQFAPAVVPGDFSGAVVDDTLNWSMVDQPVDVSDLNYTLDQTTADWDAFNLLVTLP